MTLADIAVPAAKSNTEVERRILSTSVHEGASLLSDYLNENTHNGTTYIGRDAAKLLFPDYKAAPTRNNRDCDDAASAVADAARRTVLQQGVEPSRRLVDICTGSPASGKTISTDGEYGTSLEMVHETIFTSLERAKLLIEQVFAAKRTPLVSLFYTDDPRINVRRMLERARKIGRTVPLKYMAETYVGVPLKVEQLHQSFSSSLTIRVTNNSETREFAITHNSLERCLYHTQRYTETTCLEAMHAEIEDIQSRDPIPEAIYEEARR